MLNKIFDAIFNGEVYDGLVPTDEDIRKKEHKERKEKISEIYKDYYYEIDEYQDNSYSLTVYECPIEKLVCPECLERSFKEDGIYENGTVYFCLCKKCNNHIDLIPNEVAYQEEQIKEKLATQPKCPTCTSTNVKPISTVKRTGGLFMAGLASSTFGKTYECLHCKYKW